MSATITYPFDNSSNYSFDTAKIEVSSGRASLILTDFPGQDFTETFSSDIGFTYDNTKAEFTGGQVQQKDQTPTDATAWATYTADINFNAGDGVLTGTAVGGASISGSKLDLTGGTIQYVDYDADANADSQQTGCVRLKITPNYSGSPVATRYFFSITKSNGLADNVITIYHTTAGDVHLTIRDQNNVSIFNGIVGAWSPTSAVEYEFELNWNLDDLGGGLGATRLFVDGVQLGTTDTSIGTRDSNIALLRVGSNVGATTSADHEVSDLEIFSTVQHTANYTPGYTLPETRYVASNVILPEMEDTNPGTIISFDSFTTVESNYPRYTLQIGRSGDYLYWNSSAWAVSNNTYTQANCQAVFNTNVATLPVSGEIYGQFTALFTGQNTQADISELTASMTLQRYPVDNPTLEVVTGFNTEELLSFIDTTSETASELVKYILKKDSDWYYWDASSEWIVSDETYGQANTIAEVSSNLGTFTNTKISYNTRIFLHSDSGTASPTIEELSIIYDFAGETQDTVNICTVYWYSKNPDGDPCTDEAKAVISESAKYKDNIYVCPTNITGTPSSLDGYVELELIENQNMISVTSATVTYLVSQGDKQIARISVPNSEGAILWEIRV